MRSWMAFVLVPLLLTGCGLVEPKDSEPEPNQAPTTILSASPIEGSVNTYLVPIAWRGEDNDGIVLGFYVNLDGDEWFTTDTESLFTFSSTSGSGDSLSEDHTISVAAVDDDDAMDQAPPSVSFTSYTYLPETAVAGIDSGAEVGQAVTFLLSATDPDDYIFTYSFGIDGQWVDADNDGQPDWFGPQDGVYQAIFADPAIVSGAHAPLAAGEHTFSVRAKDRAMGVDQTPATVTFTVLEGTEPETWVVGGIAADESIFVDWSAYSAASGVNRVELTVAGDASAYTGTLHSYSYKLDAADYSPWATSGDFLLSGISVGTHDLSVKARDTAGNEDSTPAELDLNLLFPDLSGGLVVVHETADGSGGAGSPTGAEVDAFYETTLGAEPHVVAYWDTLGEITPAQAGNASLILWHSDDRTETFLGEGSRLLRQYLDCAGTYGLSTQPKLLVSAFNLLVGFAEDATADTLEFVEGDFPYDYWGIQGGYSTGASRELNSVAAAVGGYPDMAVDAAKLPTPWRGNLPNVWLLTPRNDDEVLYTLVSDDGTSEYEGMPCALLRKGQDANYIILSFPLYFMEEASVTAFLEQALSDLRS